MLYLRNLNNWFIGLVGIVFANGVGVSIPGQIILKTQKNGT